MLRKIRKTFFKKRGQCGFSLIEAMVASCIVAVGFVGVYTLVAISEQFTARAIAKQKLQMQANSMLEVIESDVANIDNYAMDLGACVEPAVDETEASILRGYEWCIRMAEEMGAPQANDQRTINITTLADDRRVVHILLESHNEKVQVVMKRVFDG